MDKFTNNSFMMSALADGNEMAFDALFVEYYPKVLQFVMRFCSDKSEAENIVQDLFMELWIKRERFLKIENLDKYLFISARNAAIHCVKQSLVYCDANWHVTFKAMISLATCRCVTRNFMILFFTR